MTKTYKVELEFNLTDEEIKLLKDINENGGAIYNDSYYDDYQDYSSGEVVDICEPGLTEKEFNDRNFGGTKKIADELLELDLLRLDGESWDFRVEVSELGAQLLEQNYGNTKDNLL